MNNSTTENQHTSQVLIKGEEDKKEEVETVAYC